MVVSTPTINLDELDEQGFTVVKGFMNAATCDALRTHMDSLLPPIAPRKDSEVRRVNTLRHPIPGQIMADVASSPLLIDTAAAILRTQPDDLHMLEQVLIRSDPSNPPHGPIGWHVDQAFFPSSYDATPRQTYFHMVHALSDIPSGRATTRLVPGSHKLAYAATTMLADEAALDAFKQDPIENAGINTDNAVEVIAEQGDVLIFNPMCLHAGSPNTTDSPRYVYFASFMDRSATDLERRIKAINYHKYGYADAFRDALPASRRHLVEWWPQVNDE